MNKKSYPPPDCGNLEGERNYPTAKHCVLIQGLDRLNRQDEPAPSEAIRANTFRGGLLRVRRLADCFGEGPDIRSSTMGVVFHANLLHRPPNRSI